ncbi:unnamed protein product [Lathyrus sativus]|nr:unnamed protein product [Lathyrus sativus]
MAIITTKSIKKSYNEDEWFCYTSEACIEEDYNNGDGDSDSELNAYREGDDDDDGDYDYAPAA